MTYNYAKELDRWNAWKENEEAMLRTLGVSEQVIHQLREYDWEAFKAERRIRSRQYATHETFFLNTPFMDRREIRSISDLLDEIENEALFSYLQQFDEVTLTIVLLKILGYSTNEIAQMLKISCPAVYHRIQRLKNKLKKFTDSGQKQHFSMPI